MEKKLNIEFAKDITTGLTAQKKFLSSKYFYDDKGSKLFTLITQIPEYYLTKCEYEILTNSKETLLEEFQKNSEKFNLIELGAGDGKKTKILLKHFLNQNAKFKYFPIDISNEALSELSNNINELKEKLNYELIQGDYFQILKEKKFSEATKVILYLGSNIGNFNIEESKNFLKLISSQMKKDDLLLVGFDLKKMPETILMAYNDSFGVTKQFNLNLLARINREFNANFDLNSFLHFPVYNPETMECKSYLVSNKKQKVYISDLNLEINFDYAEEIYTESSQKYDLELINQLIEGTDLILKNEYYDCKKYFLDALFTKK